MTFAARNFSSALEPREPPDGSLGGPDAELKFRAANDQNSGHLESNQISSGMLQMRVSVMELGRFTVARAASRLETGRATAHYPPPGRGNQ